MRKSKSVGILAGLLFTCASLAVPAKAQTSSAPPVSVREIKVKPIWLNAEVVHFDPNSMVVREVGNERALHTFTYAPSAQGQVQKALRKGGFQNGDKVRIRYQPGQTVALKIRGKPSKSS